MRFHSSTKRTVGERVLSGALALTLGVSCVATNFFGLAPKDKASVAFAAPVEYTDVIRSSYTGDYQPGVTYYDFGELKGRAYYDNGWKSTGNDDTYRRNGWQIRDVHSFLDDNNDGHLDADTTKVANTLPYTTDLNSTVNDTDSVHQKELMCWQAYVTDEAARTRYLERTDVPDFASPPYGDSVEAYYIAKGDVAQDAVTGEITITWSIRSWPKDSEGWIDPDTFSKTGLTGLSGAITENGVDDTNLDDEFISYFNTHDEVDDLWNKADFSAKSLWFNSDPDTWWDGVAAAIYQADVVYTGKPTAAGYDAHIKIDNVKTVTGAAVAGSIDCDYSDAAYPTFGHVLQGQGYGAARDLLMGSVAWDAADTHDLRDYFGDPTSRVKAVRLLDTGFASLSDPSVTTTDAVIGLSLNRIAELYPTGLQHVGTEWQVKGKQMNEWKISGQLTDEAAALNYNDDKWYTFVDDTNITNGNHGGISSIKDTTSYVSIIKNLVKDGGAQWIFDMSDNEIVDTLCAAGYTPNATERAAIIALVRDVEMDYDPEKGQLGVNNLTYDGANNALGYAKYAISLPLVGFVGTLANYADTDNTIREKMYITTGYQRAAGEVVAKRVDSEISTNATTPDGIGGNTSTGYAITGAQIVDAVTCNNLVPGKKYRLVGAIYAGGSGDAGKAYSKTDKAFSGPVDVISYNPSAADLGNYVITVEDFTATAATETVDMTYNYDATGLVGTDVVVCARLYDNDNAAHELIAEHVDKDNANQTIAIKGKSATSKAVDAADNDKNVYTTTNASIKDTISYVGLNPGTDYEVVPYYNIFDADGKKVGSTIVVGSALKEFTTTTHYGDVVVTISNIDTSALDAGSTIVMGQKIYEKGGYAANSAAVIDHYVTDGTQTVSINAPAIQTLAMRKADADMTDSKNKFIPCGYDTVFVDRVSYEGLTAGKDYTLVTEIYDRTAYEADSSKVKIGDSFTKTFTAESADGYVNVDVSIDATQYVGHLIVVTETLYEANGTSLGKKIAEHVDFTDDNQSVMVETPEIHTIATGVGMGKTIATLDKVTISDEIYFRNFPTTGTYTLITGLYDVTAGKYVNDAIKTTELAGSAIQNDKFTVTFDVDTTPLAGHKLVVTQTIKHNTTSLVIHTDFSDEDQTVTVLKPELKTVAVDKTSKSKNVILSTDAVIVDTVTLTGLYPGSKYTLKAAVYDKSTGEMLNIKSGEFKFTATSASNQVVDVEITLDTAKVPSDTLVVYEYLYNNGKLITSHEDKNDEDQTVTVGVPGIKTMALDGLSNSHTGITSKKSVIKDTVTYTGLTAGVEYELQADIYDAKNGTKINTDSVTSKFTPSAANGTTVVSITVNTTDFADKSIVVFERLYLGGKLVAVHENMNDANQTVTYVKPKIRTVASNKTYDSKNIECAKSAVVVDKLYYSNFVAGRTYSVDASIVDITDDNKVVATKSFTFTADTASGNVTVEFDVDTTALKGHELVVCETVSTMSDTDGVAGDTGAFTVVHNDLKDADQTVYIDVPKIRTNASSKATGNHTVEKAEKAVIVDRVTYSGLVVGEKYSVTATPYNKATGKALEGVKPVTIKFTAEHTDGHIDVEITVNSEQLAGTTIVMFESLKYNGIEIAVHNDIDDEEQTVYVMSIKTKATAADKESKILPQNADVKVIDKVTYTGLTVGETYVLTGKLVDKDDPTKVIDEQTLEFVPTKPDGNVEITFEMNTTGKEHKSFVAFETVTQKSNGKVIGEHKDLTDADQTVTVLSPPPKTGDDSPVLFLTLAMILSFGGFIAVFTFARKRRRTE